MAGKSHVASITLVKNLPSNVCALTQGQVQLYTQVYDWNAFENDLIDDVIQIWSLSVDIGSYSSLQSFKGERGHVTMTARARVVCTGNYSGPYCSTNCGVNGCHSKHINACFH